MAVVYHVDDPVKGRAVALKRLLTTKASDAHVARLFELEYHTLSQLVHPRIIEVYDYDTDAEGPFYTMELLTGGDLRLRSPISWQETCKLLSDVCSALALMHSRRLVHRDLTPLNVRCTSDGHAKLFDFGSMTLFGRVKQIVGTPPFVAPESLNGQSLDGQTDLYALGATAYYALTGRHAYPARTLAELPEVWASAPPPPSTLVPSVPPALDTLIAELLHPVPSARPASAAEVMERLSAIGGFEIQEALLVSQSYLSTPTLVGRDEHVATFTRRLQQLSNGHGTAMYVHGQAGSGRSRLLDACALQAKLAGTLVLRVDAQASGLRRWGGVSLFLGQLLQQLPEQSQQLLAAHSVVLAPVMPAALDPFVPDSAPGDSRQSTAPTPGQPGRAELQTALREILWAVADQRPVVLVVDDMDRLDEPSAAFFALLGHRATEHPILILASAQSDAAQDAEQRAVQLFASVADGLRLRNLDAAQNEALIVSLFGDVANVRWLADRTLSVTRGNPARVMRVAHYLVQHGACNYAAGTWTLPSSLDVDVDVLTGALRETIDPSLPASALELARVLALGELARVSVDECLQLSPHRNLKQLHADLQALAAAGIVSVDDGNVGLSRFGWEPVLLAELAADRRRELHLRVANFLEHRGGANFRRIQQLLHAGEVERALDLLLVDLKSARDERRHEPTVAFEYLQGLPKNWPETYSALIGACRSLQRPVLDRLLLQIELLAFATLSARFEGACLLEVAAQLRHDTGLDLVAELASSVPEGELLTQALGAAQRRYDATSEHDRGMPLLPALTTLAQIIIQAIGMAGRIFDVALLRAMPSLAPLASLSPALAVVQKNHESALAMLSGHSERARRAYLEIAGRVSEPDGAGLEESHRFHVHAASLWAAGMMEAILGRPSTLERADAIEGNPLFAVSALRLRALHALALGDRAGAEYYRAQTELLQIQACPPQLFEGSHAMAATFGYAAIGDLVRVKQCLVDVDALARDHDGWKPIVHCGRGAYQKLRGAYAQALAEFERGLAMMTVSHLSWTYCAGSLVWTLVHQEDYQSAVTRGRALLAELEADGREYCTYLVYTPLALAESRLGLHAEALSHIKNSIATLSAEGGVGVGLGQAYEVRAYIALFMTDTVAFREYADACEAQYRLGSQNGLLARHAKLMSAARAAGLIEAEDTTEADVRTFSSADVQTTVLTAIGKARGSAERSQCALQLLGRATRSDSGFLYLVQHDDATLTAQLGSPTPWLEMDDLVARLLAEAVEEEDTTQSGDDSEEEPRSAWTARDARFTPILLSHPHDGGRIVTGLALMSLDSSGARRVPTTLVHVLSKALFDAGDALSQTTRIDR